MSNSEPIPAARGKKRKPSERGADIGLRVKQLWAVSLVPLDAKGQIVPRVARVYEGLTGRFHWEAFRVTRDGETKIGSGSEDRRDLAITEAKLCLDAQGGD